jgi:hypothetical protein
MSPRKPPAVLSPLTDTLSVLTWTTNAPEAWSSITHGASASPAGLTYVDRFHRTVGTYSAHCCHLLVEGAAMSKSRLIIGAVLEEDASTAWPPETRTRASRRIRPRRANQARGEPAGAAGHHDQQRQLRRDGPGDSPRERPLRGCDVTPAQPHALPALVHPDRQVAARGSGTRVATSSCAARASGLGSEMAPV